MKILDILNAPWAILPEKYLQIREIYYRHLEGEKADLKVIEAQLGRPLENAPKPYTVDRGVAIISIEGVIAKRMDLFSEISGGVSTQRLAEDFRTALADPEAHSILLNIDSPGGEVDGTHELARMIFESRGPKAIVALADGMMASAAYWIGSAADQVFLIGKTTQIGSIGVIATHVDVSKAYEMRGIKVTQIRAGKYKALGGRYEPLSREAEGLIQNDVDQIYSIFVDEVAQQRGVSTEKVLSDMADGRVLIGQRAVSAGLADGIMTREQLINELNRRAEARRQLRRLGAAAAARLEEL